MAEPIKIRATLQGDLTEIRLLMQHPMETGQRKDPANGRLIAAHFIQTFTVSANGKLLVEGQLNTSVSRNPLFAFRSKGLKAGDKIVVSWIDTRGDQRSDEAAVTTG
jgi:sulfur-oxidizing protein SoxZ